MLRLTGQAGAVGVYRIFHPQLPGPAVHPLHKGSFAARSRLSQDYGPVVCRADRHGLDKIPHRHRLPFLQEDLTAAHGRCVGGTGRFLVQLQAALIHQFRHQEQRHHLGHTGDGQMSAGFALIQAGSRLPLHEHGRAHGGGNVFQGRQRLHGSPAFRIKSLFLLRFRICRDHQHPQYQDQGKSPAQFSHHPLAPSRALRHI